MKPVKLTLLCGIIFAASLASYADAATCLDQVQAPSATEISVQQLADGQEGSYQLKTVLWAEHRTNNTDVLDFSVCVVNGNKFSSVTCNTSKISGGTLYNESNIIAQSFSRTDGSIPEMLELFATFSAGENPTLYGTATMSGNGATLKDAAAAALVANSQIHIYKTGENEITLFVDAISVDASSGEASEIKNIAVYGLN